MQPASPRFPRAVLYSLVTAVAAIILLEIWRPFYFLGDDNLSSTYPVILEGSRRLWSGQSPFINPYIFGGRNDWLHDPAGLCLWNPILLLISPLALTPFRLAIIDLYAAFHLLAGTYAFSSLLVRLRTGENATLSDRRIVFLTTSFIFSVWTIVVSPNWVTFLANQAALPIIFLGFYAENRKRGILLVILGFAYALMAGHLNSFVLCLVFLAVFLVSHDLTKRDWEWTRRAAVGLSVVLVCASPLLLMAYQGFAQTSRSAGLTLDFLTRFAYPVALFPIAYFFGSYASLGHAVLGPYGIAFVSLWTSTAVVFSMASWCIFLSTGAQRRWTPLEKSCAITAALIVLFIIRPVWLIQIMQHLPALKSTRIPFREVFAFLFFLHLWIASRPVTIRRPVRAVLPALGVAIYAVSLISIPFTYFTPFPLDRHLIFNGQGDAYWDRLRPLLGPNGRFVPVVAMNIEQPDFPRVPWYLLAGYNYASMLRVHSETGYVIRGMRGSYFHDVASRSPVGTFREKDIPKLHAADPELKFLVLKSYNPVRIELRDQRGVHPLVVPPLPRLTKELNFIVHE